MVTDATTDEPLSDVIVDIWQASSRELVTSVTTLAPGAFTIELPAGSYLVSTDAPPGYRDEIWNGIGCPSGSAQAGACDLSLGTPVVVTDGALTSDINFTLDPDSGIIFSDAFETGQTSSWSATVP
jgi:hypothetical protein